VDAADPANKGCRSTEGMLVEADGQSYLVESDTDAEEARTLRPLQAGR
jgi:hypothetical protein